MKTGLLIGLIAVAVIVILALTVKTKPFSDYPGNHVEDLKQIPEVDMFYKKYEDYGISIFQDGAYSYQIGFQSGTSEDQWIMLKLNYRFGILSNVFVHCTPAGIQSQYTIRENVLEYLSEENCFNMKSESAIESDHAYEDMTSSYMEKITPTLDDFKRTLSEPYDTDAVFSKFGPPHDDIGSGIHIYVYELDDLTEIWIGYTDHIWYVKHVDSDGNLMEDLFVENEN